MVKLATNLSLPLELVTQSAAILAKRRAGKSYLARRLAEQFHRAGQQIVIVDPKGDWWGIRSSADGKLAGLPVVILGGERGDVRLEVGAGEVVAKLVVEERVSVLLDLSLFRKHEVATFMAAFLESLYRLKAREIYRTPLILIVDEADAIAPQKPMKGEERMLGAAEDIVRRGGQRGIGCALITQRSAVLNKNVLTQAQVLIALRTIAPQDLAALNAWIDVHGTEEQRKTLMDSLPALPIGDAWVWSPGWPSVEGIFKRIHVLPIETFDSGATPKPGEKRIEPKAVADVDLDSLQRQMAETIERTKAEDPRELKKQIASLKAELQKKPAPAAIDPGVIERAAHDAAQQAAQKRDAEWESKLLTVRGLLMKSWERFVDEIMVALHPGEFKAPERPRLPSVALGPAPAPRTVNTASGTRSKLPKAERKILTALAQYPQGRSKVQVAVLAGYAHSGGGFNNALGSLRGKGFVEGDAQLRATDSGLSALGDWQPLPTGLELYRYWQSQLPKAERLILEFLINFGPSSKEEVALASGYEASGGGFNNALGKLRRLELIEGRGELRASENLF